MRFKPASIHKDHFDFCLFLEKIAVRNDEIRDFAVLDGAEPVGHAKNLCGGEREGAQRGVRRKSRLNGFFHRFENVFRCADASGIKRELCSSLCQGCRRGWRAIAQLESAQRWLGFGVRVLFRFGPFQIDQHGNLLGGNFGSDFVTHLAAVNRAADLPALNELERAAELHSIVRGDKNESVVLQSFGEGGLCAVVAGTRHATGILPINRLRLHAPIGVQPNLVNVGQDAEERIRKAAAESSGRLEGKRNCNWSLHDEVAGAFPRQVQNRGLTWKEAALGSANHRRETAVAPRFNALVAKACFLRAAAPGRGSGAIFRTVGPLLWAARATAFSPRGRCCRNADVCESIYESGINVQALAVNHPSLRRNGGIFADGGNDAFRNHDSSSINRRSGDGENLCAAYGEILRLAPLRMS